MRRRLPFVALAAALSLGLAAAVVAGTGLLRPTPAPATTALTTPAPAPTEVPVEIPDPTFRPAPPYVAASLDRRGIVERLQAALDQGRVDLAAPGIVASVLMPDGRQWTGVSGVADLATQRPLTADTPFAVASVSKTFVAAEILALVDAGRLDLDASVAGFLPDVRLGDAAIDPRITVRMLLNHTSGLRDYLIDTRLDKAVRADRAAAWSSRRALSYVKAPVGPPGAGYSYANTNYVLLGLIAENVTGRILAEELRARFFDPLGLTTASYQGAEPPRSELATAYRYSSGRKDAPPEDVSDGTDIRPYTSITTAAGAAGSIAASARDLARWARALYGGHVLPSAVVDQMVGAADATLRLDPAYPYGLGVQVLEISGRVTYGHSGRLVGARSVMRWFPDEGIAIAITTNESRFDPTPVLRDLLAIVAPQRIAEGLAAR